MDKESIASVNGISVEDCQRRTLEDCTFPEWYTQFGEHFYLRDQFEPTGNRPLIDFQTV